ncbi:hypothetical protein HK405_012128, partial [Cladochytrium tenue]
MCRFGDGGAAGAEGTERARCTMYGLGDDDDVDRKSRKRHSAGAGQDKDDEETEVGREEAADDWVLA